MEYTPERQTTTCEKINNCWLCVEIIVDLILISWSIALLAQIQFEFYDVLDQGADVYVANDENYFGPVQILCMNSNSKQIAHNCDKALSTRAPITPAQNYFSLKYLEIFRGDIEVTVEDIIDDRHNLFIFLACYNVIWFCLTCACKLGLNSRNDDDGSVNTILIISICYFEYSLATLKMLMINIFAISETMNGVLLLEFLPGFSLIIFMVFTILMGCCIGAMEDFYKKYPRTKTVCVWIVICLLTLYFGLFIFPAVGLNIFVLQFLFEFKAVSNGLLTMDFVKKVNLLRNFAFYMGFVGWIKSITPLISMLLAKRRARQHSRALLNGKPKPTYTDPYTIQ
eukprot:92224_1